MYQQIARNKRASLALLVIFIAIVGGLGYLASIAYGRPTLTIPILVASLVYAAVSYFASAQIAVAMSGAKPIEKRDAPELYRIVENLSITAGLPMPKVYIIDDPSPNAFATGRDPKHAIVAVTTGLLEIMDKSELEGVLAHEMSHVSNYDIRFMAIVMALVAVVSVISDIFLRISFWSSSDNEEGGSSNVVLIMLGIVGAILAPIVAMLVQLAVSRQREYLADSSGALLTRYPDGLASALAKIGQHSQPMQHASSATAHLYIANPLKGRSLAGLFETHPPIEERIKRLAQMDNDPEGVEGRA